jgi:hypothetical protein
LEADTAAAYLRKLVKGSLDPSARNPSSAKDTFWELELLGTLRDRGFNASLREPPDIIVDLEDAPAGIACKKFYSEGNVGKVLSEAVEQIEASSMCGLVAISLDDLLPPDALIRAPNARAALEHLNSLNLAFLARHERHFKNYLARGRLILAWISTGATAVVADDPRTRFNTMRQATAWSIPGLPPEIASQVVRFRRQLMS